MHYSHSTLDKPWYFAGSLWGVRLSKYFMQGVFVFDYPACACSYTSPPVLAWKNKEDKLSPPCAMRCTHPCGLRPSLSLLCRRSLLCPLASINVMVHQWCRTLSQGRTPLLIWLLLMGENTINKFNYPWPISNGGDTGLLFMSSLKYEYEEI